MEALAAAAAMEGGDSQEASGGDSLEGAPKETTTNETGDDDDATKWPFGKYTEGMLKVAHTIKPGCTHWDVKKKDFPREDRPNAAALKAEVVLREPLRKPNQWTSASARRGHPRGLTPRTPS